MVSWNPAAVPGLIAVPIVVTMAAVVFLARPGRNQNRFLAAFMLGVALSIAFGHTLRFLADSHRGAYAAYVCFGLALVVTEAFHILFLASLNVPWLRALRRPAGKAIVLGLGILVFIATALRPSLWAGGMEEGARFDVYVGVEFGLVWYFVLLLHLATGLVGIVASLQSARRAKAGLERRKGSALARAYIAFELITVPFMLWAILYFPQLDPSKIGLVATLVNFYALMLASFLLSIGLAAGILRAQLFDLDVKIKWTIKRGTLAGIFIAVFLVVSQIAQNYLSSTGGLTVGGIVTGLVLFAINPLQKVAEKLSAAAVPGARPEAIEARKLEIYRAALEGAFEDGSVTAKERTMLTRLQLELGIANAEARHLEGGVRNAMELAT